MSVTIDLTPDLESQLKTEAARQGLNADAYIVKTLRESLGQVEDRNSCLSRAETELLQEINAGSDEETWRRYKELIEKRRAKTLSRDEQLELIEISDNIERQNARRLERLVELARLRNVSVDELMKQLGMETPAYE